MANVKFQACSDCGNEQELPAVFCGSCGAPLLHISKIALTVFLTLAVGVHAIFGLYAKQLGWPAPLYGFYVVLFVMYSFVVTRRYTTLTLRMILWSSLLAYAMWFYWLGGTAAIKSFTGDLRWLIDNLEASPVGSYTVLGVTVLSFVVAFTALARRFGFMVGYRVFFTLVAGFSFGCKLLFQYVTGESGVPVNPRLSDWFTWAPETEVKELFELVAANMLRVVVFEMTVYSLVKAFKPATVKFRELMQHRAAKPGGSAGSNRALTDAATRVANTTLHSAIWLQFFARIFLRTVGTYLWALYRTLRRIFVDFLLPLACMAAVSYLLALLAEYCGIYITHDSTLYKLQQFPYFKQPVEVIPLCLVLVCFVQIIFLGAISKFPMKALWRCNSLMLLWVAPFFFAFFVIVSVSLVATSFVLHRWNPDMVSFRIGPLTIGAIVILALLIVYGLVQSRMIRPQEPREEPSNGQAEPPAESSPGQPAGSAPAAEPETIGSACDTRRRWRTAASAPSRWMHRPSPDPAP